MAQEMKYEWEREGRTEKFETITDAVRRILRVNEEARNDNKVLEHIFWTEIQGLDLNDRDDFMNKAKSGTISRAKRKVQGSEGRHYPTDPQTIFEQTTRGNHTFKDIAEFYRKQQPEVIDNYVSFIQKKVKNDEMTEEEAEEHLFGEIDISTEDDQ